MNGHNAGYQSYRRTHFLKVYTQCHRLDHLTQTFFERITIERLLVIVFFIFVSSLSITTEFLFGNEKIFTQILFE